LAEGNAIVLICNDLKLQYFPDNLICAKIFLDRLYEEGYSSNKCLVEKYWPILYNQKNRDKISTSASWLSQPWKR